MTFGEWAEAYALDDEPCTRISRRQDCEAAWNAAIKAEREACAEIADARAMRCEGEAQRYIGLDEDEVTSMRSLAWQFSVLAAEMRKRSNRDYAPTQRTTNRMSNVRELPGCKAPTNEPNDVLIKALRKTLARAESGELQSLIGTGFTQDGARFALWCPHNPNVYETLGSIAWLEHEYVTRITEQPNGT